MPAPKPKSKRNARGKKAFVKSSLRRGSKSAKISGSQSGKRRKSASSVLLPMDGPESMQDVNFNSYIKKMLKQVNPDVNLNKVSMKIMDSLVKDTMHHIAQSASSKMGKRKVLKPKVIFRGIKKVMPGPLALRVDEVGNAALARFNKKTVLG